MLAEEAGRSFEGSESEDDDCSSLADSITPRSPDISSALLRERNLDVPPLETRRIGFMDGDGAETRTPPPRASPLGLQGSLRSPEQHLQRADRSNLGRKPGVVPPLFLNRVLAGPEADQLASSPGNLTQRGSSRPVLEDSAPETSGHSETYHTGSRGQAGQITIDLVSTGFEVPEGSFARIGGTVQAASQRAAARLGVAESELQFYELQKLLPDGSIAPDSRRLAVNVRSSGFSLSALERILGENRQMSEQAVERSKAFKNIEQACAAKERELEDLRLENEELKARLNVTSRQSQLEKERRMECETRFLSLQDEIGQYNDHVHDALVPARASGGQLRHNSWLGNGWNEDGHRSTDSLPPLGASVTEMTNRLCGVLERLANEDQLSRLEQCLTLAAADHQ